MQTCTRSLPELVRLERRCFAAKIRSTRAILGWSQSEFGQHVGLTQRAVHKLEQGEIDPRRGTVRAIEATWQAQNIEFEDMADGGFRVVVRADVVDRPAARARRDRQAERAGAGVGSLATHRSA